MHFSDPRVSEAVKKIKYATGIQVPFNGLFGFDLIEFDAILQKSNPDYLKTESTHDFITRKYGKEIVDACFVLLDVKSPFEFLLETKGE